MKRQKVTYGVYNVVEWHAILKSGKATIKVHFANGATTLTGVTPATFTTSDPVSQLMIERTEEYKSGRIKRIRAYELGGNVVGQKNAAVPASEGTEEDSTTEGTDDTSADSDDTTEEEATVTTVSVSDLAAAKDYLAENFGIDRSQLKSKAQITAQAAAHKIEFVYSE